MVNLLNDRSEIRKGRLAQVPKEDRDTALSTNILMLHTDLQRILKENSRSRRTYNSKGLSHSWDHFFQNANLRRAIELLLRNSRASVCIGKKICERIIRETDFCLPNLPLIGLMGSSSAPPSSSSLPPARVVGSFEAVALTRSTLAREQHWDEKPLLLRHSSPSFSKSLFQCALLVVFYKGIAKQSSPAWD
jgi:hypothetical protein